MIVIKAIHGERMLEASGLLNHALEWYLKMANMLDSATDVDYYSFSATPKMVSSNSGFI